MAIARAVMLLAVLASTASAASAGTAGALGRVAIRIKVPRPGPAAGTAGHVRRPLYVSAATQSFVVLMNGKQAAIANTTATEAVQIFLLEPAGTDTKLRACVRGV